MALSVLIGLAALLPASALAASAGLKPSEAPLVEVGQHYFGNTAHDLNAGTTPVDLWSLPPLLTGDAITVAWQAESNYPEVPRLCLAQNVDDYSWAESGNICNGSESYLVSGSGVIGSGGGSARSVIEAKSASSSAFLEFLGDTCEGCDESYDFVIESIQHTVGVGLLKRLHIRTNSVLWATANLANGAPVPDGLTFYLDASWPDDGHAQYSAVSSGGAVSFPISLPPETETQKVSFTVTRPADPQYLEAKSAALSVKVARPKPEPAPPVPVAHHHKPLQCHKGFKKRRVRGKARCVRVKATHHRHRHHRH